MEYFPTDSTLPNRAGGRVSNRKGGGMQGELPASDSGRIAGEGSMIGAAEVQVPTAATSTRRGALCAPSIEASPIREAEVARPIRKITHNAWEPPSGQLESLLENFGQVLLTRANHQQRVTECQPYSGIYVNGCYH